MFRKFSNSVDDETRINIYITVIAYYVICCSCKLACLFDASAGSQSAGPRTELAGVDWGASPSLGQGNPKAGRGAARLGSVSLGEFCALSRSVTRCMGSVALL